MNKDNFDINKIIEAAKAGGEVLSNYFGQSLDTVQKTIASDFKTKADEESEAAIVKVLNQYFPSNNILSEESGESNNNSEYTFVIDPLDGTNNFVLGIPNFSVSIGLLHNKEIIAGVIYQPVTTATYWAEKGKGAFLDGNKLQVNKESSLEKSSICFGCNYNSYQQYQVKTMETLYDKKAKRVLINWSPTFDFCMLASGKVEGVIMDNAELHDFAAGKLIVRESGAKVTDFKGQSENDDTNTRFVMSNGTEIHDVLVGIARNFKQ